MTEEQFALLVQYIRTAARMETSLCNADAVKAFAQLEAKLRDALVWGPQRDQRY